MTLTTLFEKLLIISLLAMAILYFIKDRLPDPALYGESRIEAPRQKKSERKPFEVEVENERYRITPKYDYMLEGVVVSRHSADALLDIVHHEEWHDFLNVADLCVIWGENVRSGVYREMDFSNGNWTCYYSWPNSSVKQRFRPDQLSNNHLLTQDDLIGREIEKAHPGDLVRIEGMLVEYANPSNGFKRGTSVTRNDTGQGACETIYVEAFDILKRANALWQSLFAVAKFLFVVSLLALLFLFFASSNQARKL